ncbi:BED zinc finger [Aphelenchoides fujianensis]|nr:BED zinc finger [Aphelenchoides fujianensis]
MLNSPVPSELSGRSAFKHASTPGARFNDSFGIPMLTPSSTFDSPGLPPAALSAFQHSTPLSSIGGNGGGGKARRTRPRGQTNKTALVWEFFEQRPDGEQAATCKIESCRKIIKATNSSTTGMIRHLRSCHRPEHEHLEKAKQKKLWDSVVRGEMGPELTRFMSGQNEGELQLQAASDGSPPPHQSPSAASPHSTASIDQTASSSSSVAASSVREQQKSAGLHSIESMLATAAFVSPGRYMLDHKRNLQQIEENAKKTVAAGLVHDEEEASGDEHKEEEQENDHSDEHDQSDELNVSPAVSEEEAARCWACFLKFMAAHVTTDEETLHKLDQINAVFQALRKARAPPSPTKLPQSFE